MKTKDFDYVARLEKAIKRKYGDEAIQNPEKFWNEKKEQQYLMQLKDYVAKQRKFEAFAEPENVNGILISRKLLTRENICSCPVCKTRIRTINDDIYITKFECCEKCYFQYVDDREKRWLEGWRPDNAEKRKN